VKSKKVSKKGFKESKKNKSKKNKGEKKKGKKKKIIRIGRIVE
jgi:hypothetical protein